MRNRKNIVFGVCGSIAVYKVPDLIRLLVKEGYRVSVVMTEEATRFVSKMVFESVSNGDVYVSEDLWNRPLLHTEINIHLLVILPATFNIIGKISAGIADDLLTCIVAARRFPIMIAPAMNNRMWENKINMENIERLKKRGFLIIDPEEGELACGEEGKGRLPSIDRLYLEIMRVLEGNGGLKDKKVMITCGKTAEPIDNARVITNNSSGLTGIKIAESFFRKGARVTVIHGYTSYEIPYFLNPIRVERTEDAKDSIIARAEEMDIIIMNMAVSDYKVIERKKDKYKGRYVLLQLEKTPDILKYIKDTKAFKVGFSLEEKEIIKRAVKKMKEKNLDMMIANPSHCAGKDYIEGYFIYKDGRVEEFLQMPKEKFARAFVEKVEKEYARG